MEENTMNATETTATTATTATTEATAKGNSILFMALGALLATGVAAAGVGAKKGIGKLKAKKTKVEVIESKHYKDSDDEDFDFEE